MSSDSADADALDTPSLQPPSQPTLYTTLLVELAALRSCWSLAPPPGDWRVWASSHRLASSTHLALRGGLAVVASVVLLCYAANFASKHPLRYFLSAWLCTRRRFMRTLRACAGVRGRARPSAGLRA